MDITWSRLYRDRSLSIPTQFNLRVYTSLITKLLLHCWWCWKVLEICNHSVSDSTHTNFWRPGACVLKPNTVTLTGPAKAFLPPYSSIMFSITQKWWGERQLSLWRNRNHLCAVRANWRLRVRNIICRVNYPVGVTRVRWLEKADRSKCSVHMYILFLRV